MLPWLICGALALAVLVLLVKFWLLRRSLDEIVQQLGERLSQDTNSPIFLSTRDAHARKLAAELNLQLKELRQARQKFQQGDMELKNAITNISHDLRTPLTAIQGYLDLLEREEALSPNTRRYLDSIHNRMEAMTRLTEELFRYSLAADQPEAPREAVDLRRILEESLVSFYAAMVQRGITPEISLPEGPVVRSLDPSAVSRIFGRNPVYRDHQSGGNIREKIRAHLDGGIHPLYLSGDQKSNHNTAGDKYDIEHHILY